MKTLTEQTAELLIAEHAFAPGMPGLIGAAVDLEATTPGLGRLRHGFLVERAPGVVSVSSAPSPGLESCLARTADDLLTARILAGLAATKSTAGVRVGLEAGLAGGGPYGLDRRWALAHAVAPVLAAAFANSPLRDGRPSGWRSLRQSRHSTRPLTPLGAPSAAEALAGGATAHEASRGTAAAAWTAFVMDAPTSSGATFRELTRGGSRPGLADLARHLDTLRPPVAARGHLVFDVADGPPGDDWRVVVAVTAALLDDYQAADTAQCATAALTTEPRVWERAARDGLTDPALAAAARECFLAAYAALARHGVARELRDAVAVYTERYVLRGRCPADDVLDRVTA